MILILNSFYQKEFYPKELQKVHNKKQRNLINLLQCEMTAGVNFNDISLIRVGFVNLVYRFCLCL